LHYHNGGSRRTIHKSSASSLISGIIAFLIFGLARFTKTSDSIVTRTVKLAAMKNDFSEMEKSVNKVLDSIDDVITQQREQRENVKVVWSRLEDISSELKYHEYRLGESDMHRQQGEIIVLLVA
jgi:peptidoglycan hydrolase CwlO-like protein